jgi:hypothetical protein
LPGTTLAANFGLALTSAAAEACVHTGLHVSVVFHSSLVFKLFLFHFVGLKEFLGVRMEAKNWMVSWKLNEQTEKNEKGKRND